MKKVGGLRVLIALDRKILYSDRVTRMIGSKSPDSNEGNMMQPPAISTTQMIEVDRLMIEEYGISLVQMMENAGNRLASLAIRLLAGEKNKVVVLCGSGNNGGGGMAAARHLHNRGVDVRLALAARPEHLKEVPARQWEILQKIGLPPAGVEDLSQAGLILDALIGYGVRGNPRGEVAEWIRRANGSNRPILSLDAPSGLDTASGIPGDPCIRAFATLTLALPKSGLVQAAARDFVGDLYLADIGVPPELYAKMGIPSNPIFLEDTILKI